MRDGDLTGDIDAHVADLSAITVSDQGSGRTALARVLVSVSELHRRLEQSPETDVPEETLRTSGILSCLTSARPVVNRLGSPSSASPSSPGERPCAARGQPAGFRASRQSVSSSVTGSSAHDRATGRCVQRPLG